MLVLHAEVGRANPERWAASRRSGRRCVPRIGRRAAVVTSTLGELVVLDIEVRDRIVQRQARKRPHAAIEFDALAHDLLGVAHQEVEPEERCVLGSLEFRPETLMFKVAWSFQKRLFRPASRLRTVSSLNSRLAPSATVGAPVPL